MNQNQATELIGEVHNVVEMLDHLTEIMSAVATHLRTLAANDDSRWLEENPE